MLSRGRAGCTRSARCRNPRTAPFQPWVGSATQSWPDISRCRSHRRPSSSASCWRCPRRHLSRFMVQFLSLCGQDLLLAGCRRRLHDAPEWSIVLLDFFVRTAILLNRLRCTAILSALQAGEEAENGRSGSQGGAFAFKKIRPRPRHHRDRRHPL